jgi:hypothetical protein
VKTTEARKRISVVCFGPTRRRRFPTGVVAGALPSRLPLGAERACLWARHPLSSREAMFRWCVEEVPGDFAAPPTEPALAVPGAPVRYRARLRKRDDRAALATLLPGGRLESAMTGRRRDPGC